MNGNPLLPQTPEAAVTTEEPITAGDEAATNRMPSVLEATEGTAPEITTHSESAVGGGGVHLSPEERAITGTQIAPEPAGDAEAREYADEDAETAALAEGRVIPPTSTRDEPV